MESLTLQVDGPITGRAYKRGGGGGGVISGILRFFLSVDHEMGVCVRSREVRRSREVKNVEF